jgi:hypothetical protein
MTECCCCVNDVSLLLSFHIIYQLAKHKNQQQQQINPILRFSERIVGEVKLESNATNEMSSVDTSSFLMFFLIQPCCRIQQEYKTLTNVYCQVMNLSNAFDTDYIVE